MQRACIIKCLSRLEHNGTGELLRVLHDRNVYTCSARVRADVSRIMNAADRLETQMLAANVTMETGRIRRVIRRRRIKIRRLNIPFLFPFPRRESPINSRVRLELGNQFVHLQSRLFSPAPLPVGPGSDYYAMRLHRSAEERENEEPA